MQQLKVLVLFGIERFTDDYMFCLAKGLASQLEKLQLEDCTAKDLTTNGLKKMIPFATKLSLLTVESTKVKIDADDYNAMLNTLQERPERIMFLLELTGNRTQVEVSEAMLMENRQNFYIELKISHVDDLFNSDLNDSGSDSDDFGSESVDFGLESDNSKKSSVSEMDDDDDDSTTNYDCNNSFDSDDSDNYFYTTPYSHFDFDSDF